MGDTPASPRSVLVEFPTKLYGLEAIKRAAYRLSDRLVVDVLPGERTIQCSLQLRKANDAEQAALLVEEFKLEVLDQDLRSSIAIETEAVRNLILAYAFSKTGLQGE